MSGQWRDLLSLTLGLCLLLQLLCPAWGFQSCPSVCTCKWKNGKRWVECQEKQQITIPDNIDPETQVLDLGGNNLQILPREVFSRHGLLNLQKLKLSNCKIGQIDPTAFRGLTNLVELDLSSNKLASVPTPTFSDIPYLRELALNNNPLSKIEAHAFEMVPQIVALDVSGCEIKKISARAFQNIKQLERLYLHNNKIEEIKARAVESMAGLHSLTLHGNPWGCDCGLRPLLDWLVSANLPMVDTPRCQAPARLAGQRFADIPLSKFACAPELLPGPRYVEANIGSNASLVCKISSIPAAAISWQFEGKEMVNNSRLEGGGVAVVRESRLHQDRTLSTINIIGSKESEGGRYKCIAENSAGRVETNFTLNIGHFSSPGELNSGEIIGVSITVILLVMIFLVIIAVLVLKVSPSSLLREKTRPPAPRQEALASPDTGQAAHLEMNFTSVQEEQTAAGRNSVVINGTTYTGSGNGLANGYINPDVIPSSVPDHGSGSGSVSVMSGESEEAAQNRVNSQQGPDTDIGLVTQGPHRYANFPPPVVNMGVTAHSQRHSFTYSPALVRRSNAENNRLYGGGGTLPSHYTSYSTYDRGAVNGSFSDESSVVVGGPGSLVSLTPPSQLRHTPHYNSLASRHAHDRLQASSAHQQPGLYSSSSPFFHGTLPKTGYGRPGPGDWMATPLSYAHAQLPLPDWDTEWAERGEAAARLSYPSDFGLPIARPGGRPEIHVAQNPLDTLEEEDIFPDQTLSSSSLQSSTPGQTKLAPLSDSSYATSTGSGRGGSGLNYTEENSWNISSPSPAAYINGGSLISAQMINGVPVKKKPFGSCSARESPDEGIQTDSGTDV